MKYVQYITAFLAGLVCVGVVYLMYLNQEQPLGSSTFGSAWFITATGPQYVGTLSDGCAQWSSNILTTTGSGCGGGGGLHVDGGGFVYPQTGDYHSAPKYVATSSESTFLGRTAFGTTTFNTDTVITAAATSSDTNYMVATLNTDSSLSTGLGPSGYNLTQGTTPYWDIYEIDQATFGGMYMSGGNLRLYTDGSFIRFDDNLYLVGVTIQGGIVPDTNDAYDLGASGAGWAGLWLGPDECINFNSVECVLGDAVSSDDFFIDPISNGRFRVLADTAIATTTYTTNTSLTVAASSTNTTKLLSLLNDDATEVISITDEGLMTLGSTASIDAGGAVSFELPNGTNPTVDATGECAFDTTTGQLICYNGSSVDVHLNSIPRALGSIGSTSPDRYLVSFDSGTTTWSLGSIFNNATVPQVLVYTDTGTCNVVVGDGGASTTVFVASTTKQAITYSSNNAFTTSDHPVMEIGSCTGSPNWIDPTIEWIETRQ